MVTETSKGNGKVIKVDGDALKRDGETLTGAADALNDDGKALMGNEEALKDNEKALRVTGCVGEWHERDIERRLRFTRKH